MYYMDGSDARLFPLGFQAFDEVLALFLLQRPHPGGLLRLPSLLQRADVGVLRINVLLDVRQVLWHLAIVLTERSLSKAKACRCLKGCPQIFSRTCRT